MGCPVAALSGQLSAMTALTNLSLAGNKNVLGAGQNPVALAPLADLQQLQCLDLSWCGLMAVPELLAPAALTQLRLAGNSSLGRAAGGQDLSALAPLAARHQLQCLDLSWCGLMAVPGQLSALTAQTQLDLEGNINLAGGWQHLRPLVCLRNLDLTGLLLPGGVPPELSELPTLTCLKLLKLCR